MRYILLSLMLILFLVPSASHASEVDLRITELNPSGSVGGSCKSSTVENRCAWDKWLEITNFSNSEFDLGGWKLVMRGEEISNSVFIFPSGATITAKESLIIGYTEKDFISQTAAKYRSFSVLRMSNNESERVNVALINNSGIQVDGANFVFTGLASRGVSTELNDLGIWQKSVHNFSGDNFGTPGYYSFPVLAAEPVNQVTLVSIPEIAAIEVQPLQVEVVTSAQISKQLVKDPSQKQVTTPRLVAPLVETVAFPEITLEPTSLVVPALTSDATTVSLVPAQESKIQKPEFAFSQQLFFSEIQLVVVLLACSTLVSGTSRLPSDTKLSLQS